LPAASDERLFAPAYEYVERLVAEVNQYGLSELERDNIEVDSASFNFGLPGFHQIGEGWHVDASRHLTAVFNFKLKDHQGQPTSFELPTLTDEYVPVLQGSPWTQRRDVHTATPDSLLMFNAGIRQFLIPGAGTTALWHKGGVGERLVLVAFLRLKNTRPMKLASRIFTKGFGPTERSALREAALAEALTARAP
jgi:hypothetical protein